MPELAGRNVTARSSTTSSAPSEESASVTACPGFAAGRGLSASISQATEPRKVLEGPAPLKLEVLALAEPALRAGEG